MHQHNPGKPRKLRHEQPVRWITDWEALASKAHYRVIEVSGIFTIPPNLHTFIIETFGCSPRHLFEELRLHSAFALLSEHKPLKEIAAQLSLTPASLCRFFNRIVGCAPSNYPLPMSAENEERPSHRGIAKAFDGCPARPQATQTLLA
jgi:AraC-like DNA-binding protein